MLDPHRTAPSDKTRSPAERTDRRIALIWALLTINVLGAGGDMIIPVPRSLMQVVTMGSLAVAFVLALRINPRITVHFNTYLTVLTVLAVLALVTSARLEVGLGSLVRCARFLLFVGTLWLLTPWWRGDLRFVRLHIRAMVAILISVILGLMVNPGFAFAGATGGRLTGILWPIPPTQVGAYGALTAGLGILFWISGALAGRQALGIVLLAVTCMVLSHTRTAMVGFVVGVALTGVGLLFSSGRGRRAVGVVAVLVAVVALAIPEFLLDWFERDQGSGAMSELTGRAKVWDAVLAKDRSTTQQLIGVGLTDKSYGGLSIDSTWMATYHELGQFGVVLVGLLLVVLLVAIMVRPPSLARRCAGFLIVYCGVASYTEVGLGDASPYLLHLAVAASLLAKPGIDTGGTGPAAD